MTAANRVTLYRVRRPDGTVIEAPAKDHRYSAVVAASYSEPQLSNLILAADENQKFDDYLKITGYTIEPVEYAPLPSDQVRETVREALKQSLEHLSAIPNDHIVSAWTAKVTVALSELERIWGK